MSLVRDAVRVGPGAALLLVGHDERHQPVMAARARRLFLAALALKHCPGAVGGSDRCAELLDNIPEFDTLFTRKTPQEIQVMLDEWLAGEDSAGDDVVKYDNNGSTTSVDNAFNELMNA